MEFIPFTKIPRLSRECVITEKLDGTNAQIMIVDYASVAENRELPCVRSGELALIAGSRTRWISPTADNYGFAKWVFEHSDELAKLGPGQHIGEWWGAGIQRGYGLPKGEKRFSLFNTSVWNADNVPAGVSVVPVLYQGGFDTKWIEDVLDDLRINGSKAAPGFMNPEGVVIFHTASNSYFKKTIEKDEEPKSKEQALASR